MKKLLSAITALAMCGLLSACGNGGETADTNTTAETTASVPSETAATTAETIPDSHETIPEEPTETQTETEAVTEKTTAETTVTTDFSEQITTTSETEEIEETSDESVPDEEIVIDDNEEEIAVNSSFADMDEFLAADIFMLDGKNVSAAQSLSADIFNTLNGSFYLETSNFDGSSPFKLAIEGNMVMTESEIDGKANKLIIRDSKAYTFDHENKVAIYLPADKDLVSQYTPEKMDIIPKDVSKESFVIADVTIGGKAYKFEYGTTSDWAMLYDADGKLYASIKSGDSLDCELCKFSVTSKIPSGTFDIPEDYFQLNLEEMMQNAPPPEDME